MPNDTQINVDGIPTTVYAVEKRLLRHMALYDEADINVLKREMRLIIPMSALNSMLRRMHERKLVFWHYETVEAGKKTSRLFYYINPVIREWAKQL